MPRKYVRKIDKQLQPVVCIQAPARNQLQHQSCRWVIQSQENNSCGKVEKFIHPI